MNFTLRPDPDLLDLAAWRERLAELRAQPADLIGRDVALEHAETMVELLEGTSENGAVEAI